MRYTYIDGDSIGLKIEQSFLNNNEEELVSINSKVHEIVSQITNYLKQNNQEIIFSGADGIIAKGQNLNLKSLIQAIRNYDKEFTFSAGVGSSLKNCYIALRYAKSYSKNIVADYSNDNEFKIIGDDTTY